MTPDEIYEALTDIELKAMDIHKITQTNGSYADTVKDAKSIEEAAMKVRAAIEVKASSSLIYWMTTEGDDGTHTVLFNTENERNTAAIGWMHKHQPDDQEKLPNDIVDAYDQWQEHNPSSEFYLWWGEQSVGAQKPTQSQTPMGDAISKHFGKRDNEQPEQPLDPKTESIARETTAMCIWEYMLALSAKRDFEWPNGVAQARDEATKLIDPCNEAAAYVYENDLYGESFDWDFVPWFIENCTEDGANFKLKPGYMNIVINAFNKF